MTSSSLVARVAQSYAELPVEFRAAHPKPREREPYAVAAWLNGIHKGLEVECQRYLDMTAHALMMGDTDTASQLLINARPYRDAMAALDELGRQRRTSDDMSTKAG